MPTKGCTLAVNHSAAWVARERQRLWEGAGKRKPHGYKMGASCGDPRCIAPAHIQLELWKMYTRNFPTPWGTKIAAR